MNIGRWTDFQESFDILASETLSMTSIMLNLCIHICVFQESLHHVAAFVGLLLYVTFEIGLIQIISHVTMINFDIWMELKRGFFIVPKRILIWDLYFQCYIWKIPVFASNEGRVVKRQLLWPTLNFLGLTLHDNLSIPLKYDCIIFIIIIILFQI